MSNLSQYSMDDPHGEVLFGMEAYHWDMMRVPVFSSHELAAVVQAAQQGDQDACERLFARACRSIWLRACRMAWFYRVMQGCWFDPQDLAQHAAIAAWRSFDRALARPEPLGYLLRAAKWAMQVYCREHQSLLRVPHTSQWRGARAAEVVSLEALCARSARGAGVLATFDQEAWLRDEEVAGPDQQEEGRSLRWLERVQQLADAEEERQRGQTRGTRGCWVSSSSPDA
jgi:DNA-directed RNA polymerase specialized sigma24 family protein